MIQIRYDHYELNQIAISKTPLYRTKTILINKN